MNQKQTKIPTWNGHKVKEWHIKVEPDTHKYLLKLKKDFSNQLHRCVKIDEIIKLLIQTNPKFSPKQFVVKI
jgi:hypothetical protein